MTLLAMKQAGSIHIFRNNAIKYILINEIKLEEKQVKFLGR